MLKKETHKLQVKEIFWRRRYKSKWFKSQLIPVAGGYDAYIDSKFLQIRDWWFKKGKLALFPPIPKIFAEEVDWDKVNRSLAYSSTIRAHWYTYLTFAGILLTITFFIISLIR